MAVLDVNPTRMELNKLKDRLLTARRGHKLLKDKRDGLMRKFLETAKKTAQFRIKIEKDILNANLHFEMARAQTSKQIVGSALLIPSQELTVKVSASNIMGVSTPSFSLKRKFNSSENISYALSQNSIYLDEAINLYENILPNLVKLAEQEKTISILADEIEQTRRKVNALEHMLIPNYQDTIRFIALKLDENERSNIARLSRAK